MARRLPRAFLCEHYGIDAITVSSGSATRTRAEQDAADAIDYAVFVVYDAQLAVLDALDYARNGRGTGAT